VLYGAAGAVVLRAHARPRSCDPAWRGGGLNGRRQPGAGRTRLTGGGRAQVLMDVYGKLVKADEFIGISASEVYFRTLRGCAGPGCGPRRRGGRRRAPRARLAALVSAPHCAIGRLPCAPRACQAMASPARGLEPCVCSDPPLIQARRARACGPPLAIG